VLSHTGSAAARYQTIKIKDNIKDNATQCVCDPALKPDLALDRESRNRREV
jgi:hypothetical protein